MNKKQSFAELASVLMTATLVSKIFGAAFKIPLAAFLGGEGMGYYMTAYSVFGPVSAVAISGMTAAVSKVIAEHSNDISACKNLLNKSLLLYGIIGTVISLLIYLCADNIAKYCSDIYGAFAIKCIAPAFLFCSLSASVRGYFEGIRNMYPTAFGEVAESVVKLVCGSFFAYSTARILLNNHEFAKKIFKIFNTNSESTAALTAAAAVLGVSISAFSGFVVSSLFISKNEKNKLNQGKNIPLSLVIKTAIPICMSSLVANVSSVIDLSTIAKRINYAKVSNPNYFFSRFEFLGKNILQSERTGVYFFGAYTGMAMTLFNIVTTVATVFQVSAIPVISTSLKNERMNKTAQKTENIVKYCLILTLPLGIGLCCHGEAALKILFHGKTNEIKIINESLKILGIGGGVVGLLIACNGIIQALGDSWFVLFIMMLTAAFKYLLNYMLISVPQINIKGAAISAVISYSFALICVMIKLKSKFKSNLNLSSAVIKPIICGLIFLFSNILFKKLFILRFSNIISSVFSALFSGIIYILFIFLLKIVIKKE